ncbi:MAG: MerR family transcriptional regulator, partial [Microbacteriaceae bacterium]|nr:MerR family transcriptional regulator [Microbacteriaceae bacterium]
AGGPIMGLAAADSRSAGRKLYSIGEIEALLRSEFPDVRQSKLRFLEDEGLIVPHRSASGYRKYSQAHVDRLRLI